MSGLAANYLRLSITDQCNFNCFYCQPAARRDFFREDEILSREEIVRAAAAFIRLGVRHIRLTGGEPLMRSGLELLLRDLAGLAGLERLSLTTNGFALSRFAQVLKECRVHAINVSLDSLQRSRFSKIAGRDALPWVKAGIAAAQRAGVPRVKLNVLLIRGFNDDEVCDFVDFSRDHGLDVRFIEYFPTHRLSEIFKMHYVPSQKVRAAIEARYGALEPLGADPLAGPATYYRIPQDRTRIGFISSVTGAFCDTCNRLRLTADGKLYACLHSDYCADIRPVLAADVTDLEALIRTVANNKKEHTKALCRRAFDMSAIGG